MKITIFGATGVIGSQLVEISLEKGSHVIAYVRNAEKLKIAHKNLTLIVGQITDLSTIEKAISDSDVVISTLGPAMNTKGSNMSTPIADGHANIIKAMKKLNKLRLITLATPNVSAEEDIKNVATVFPKLAARVFLPSACRDIIKMGELIKTSDLELQFREPIETAVWQFFVLLALPNYFIIKVHIQFILVYYNFVNNRGGL